MNDRFLKGRRTCQPLGAFLRIQQLLLVGCERRPEAGLKPLVDPVLLAPLDDRGEAEEADKKRHNGQKNEIDNKTARETRHRS